MKNCRLCLNVRVKVFKLGNTEHRDFINSILKLKGFNDVVSEDHYACYICMAVLTKTCNFMQMVVNAQQVLCDLLKANDQITIPMLMNIDRHKKGLNLINLNYVHDTSKPNEIMYHEFEKKYNLNTNESNKENQTTKEVITNEISLSEVRQKATHIFSEASNHCKKEDSYVQINDGCDENVEQLVEDEYYVLNVKKEIDDPLVVEKIKSGKSETIDIHVDALDGTESLLIPRYYTKADEPVNKILSETTSTSKKKKKGKTVQVKKEGNVGQLKRRYPPKVIIDEDYKPDSTSHSEDSDFDVYDDTGRQIKRQKVQREYPRKCDHCEYEVPKSGVHYHHYLYAHPNVTYPYAEEKMYACSYCGKLQTQQGLNNHETKHKYEVIKCQLCPKICSNRIQLNKHRSGVHPNTTYTCDHCSKTFKTKSDFTRHIRIHTGEKPFKCHICGAAFAHSGNRTIHIRSAHQNYKCVPKKRKPTQKVRRNKKNDVTDTETESSDEERIHIKRIKHHKMPHCKNETKTKNHPNAEVASKNKETKRTRKTRKNVQEAGRRSNDDHNDAEMKSKDEKQTPRNKNSTQKYVCKSQDDDTSAESDSDEETLAKKKEKCSQE